VSDLWGLEPGAPPEGLVVPPRAWQSVSTQAWLALGGVGTPHSHCSAQEPITMLSTLTGTIGVYAPGLGGRGETLTTGTRGERGCTREVNRTKQQPLAVTH
jgi:hypothetical protein